MPASITTLRMALIVCFVADVIGATGKLGMSIAMAFSAGQILILGTAVYILLKINNKTERSLQTLFSIFGTLALINLASLPFIQDLNFLQEGKLVITNNLIIVGLLQLWFFITMARVLRDALETRMFRAILLTFLIVNIVPLVLANVAGMVGWEGPIAQLAN